MKIHSLKIDDYKEIIKLWSLAGLPFRPKVRDSKEAITVQLEANPDFFLGAFEDSHLVGTVIISCDGRKGWINRLAVHPDYRRLGIAEALIAESEKVLKKHGIKIFCASIENHNAASKKLFKKCGYTEHPDIVYFSKRESDDV
jgi:ribosomal protein S18 acetylase RimI-like enzyme